MFDTKEVQADWLPLAIVADAFNREHGDMIDFRDFMFMGVDSGVSMYKHYATRSYLHVSPDGPVLYIGVGYEPTTWTPEFIRSVVEL